MKKKKVGFEKGEDFDQIYRKQNKVKFIGTNVVNEYIQNER